LAVGLVFVFASFKFAPKAKADFDANNLISDGAFVDINAMDAGAIQRFLQNKNSYLKDFSENGRTAAQIIYDAAHGKYDAAGTYNGIVINESTGTVNPEVILVTLQKEQSLITKTTRDDNALRKAMGYACPDSGSCNPSYSGFSKQVENGAWQLRYNYERAQGRGFDGYQVGDNMCFDDWNGEHCVTIANRATASLYRYTPHVYNGNYNFWNLYNSWFIQRDFYAELVSQSAYPTLNRGDSASLTVSFKNTGTQTWNKTGTNMVKLALDRYWAGHTAWQGSGWISENRIAYLNETSVVPGNNGSFTFNIHCPSDMSFGEHRFYVRLVVDGVEWFDNPNTNGAVWWKIFVPGPSASYVGQSSNVTMLPGDTANMWVSFRNTGIIWRQGSPNPTRLAVDKYRNEATIKRFYDSSWISPDRIAPLPSETVANGNTARFDFKVKAPNDIGPGSYRFDVRLVQDGLAWLEADSAAAWWRITLPAPSAELTEQSGYPTLSRGDTADLYVKFKNTTGAAWKSSGTAAVRLAVDKNWAQRTAWQGAGWLSENRITAAQEGDVAPWTTGTFRFKIHVPDDMPSGQHRFFVRLVMDGYSWFESDSAAVWWNINVR